MKEKKFLRDIDKVRLNIYYKPSDPKSKSMAVHLPPLPQGSQIQNLAMSSLPDLENEDWVVAIKLGSQLKLYRHKDLRWIDIETTHGHETISPYSSLMYSKKDKRFLIPTPGGEYLCSFDLNFKEKGKPDYNLMWKKDIPQYMMYDLEEMNSFTRTDHLVESASGEQFLISWYISKLCVFYFIIFLIIYTIVEFEENYRQLLYLSKLDSLSLIEENS